LTNVFSELIHRALQVAAREHRDQLRKGSADIPYISHPTMVALLLQRAGFDDEVTLAAAILHDVAEDTAMSIGHIARDFGPQVATLVDCLTETKKDAQGQPLPWAVRKEEKREKLQQAPVAAKAIALADKVHNLYATLLDLRAGQDVWTRFNARKDQWLENVDRAIAACSADDPRLQSLADACRKVLDELRKS
jgi:(p)ppGpp synthase/HD superfamily hydrolase